jgi:predicted molibdopterin-dependent oxidoreductase YjgC
VEHARDALAHLEHLVFQDIFLTETAKYADVVLPAWPEKDGTVSNTNRQVQIGRAALPIRATPKTKPVTRSSLARASRPLGSRQAGSGGDHPACRGAR